MIQGWFLNGTPISDNPRHLPGNIISALPNLSLWSNNAISDLLCQIMEMMLEMAEEERQGLKGTKRANLTRLINPTKQALKHMPKEDTKAIIKIYDLLLRGEGLGLLRGFFWAFYS